LSLFLRFESKELELELAKFGSEKKKGAFLARSGTKRDPETCRGNGRNGFLMEMASGDRGASAGVDKLKEPCTNAAD